MINEERTRRSRRKSPKTVCNGNLIQLLKRLTTWKEFMLSTEEGSITDRDSLPEYKLTDVGLLITKLGLNQSQEKAVATR